MEFDIIFESLRIFGRLKIRLRPETKRLLHQYADFHGVSPDQIVDEALNKVFIADEAFCNWVADSHTSTPKQQAV